MKLTTTAVFWSRINNSNSVWPGHNYNWFFMWYNPLHKDVRFWGYDFMWHDGPFGMFGFWYFSMIWCTYNMRIPKPFGSDE